MFVCIGVNKMNTMRKKKCEEGEVLIEPFVKVGDGKRILSKSSYSTSYDYW